MNRNRNQNVLLVEIMIAVLFFALCSTVILETFMAARRYEERSRTETAALTELQNMTERLYAAEDVDALLTECGYSRNETGWQMDCGEYTIDLTVDEELTLDGLLRTTLICARQDGELIAEIPGARYLPGGEAQ